MIYPERHNRNSTMKSYIKQTQRSLNFDDALTRKRLTPCINLNHDGLLDESQKIEETGLMSIQEAIDVGEANMLYQVKPDKSSHNVPLNSEELNLVGIGLVNLEFDNTTCQMIFLKNWTTYIRLRLSQQSKQVSDMMTATVSHEMRTPINSILTMIESLILMTDSPETLEMLRIIKNSAFLLLYLVNDMLDMYMIKTGKFHKILDDFFIDQELKDIYDMFSPQSIAKRVELRLEIDRSTPYQVISDKRRFKQTIINLVSNALKFTNQGSILITISFDPISQFLKASVKDSGIGISEKDQKQLFKLFGKIQSSKDHNKQGIGLGLNICRQIVEQFEGKIHCESHPGQGATFTFTWKVDEVKI